MKDMTKKIRSKGRMDANNSWWVSGLLAADCEKAWLHAGLEDTMQKWCDWLGEMKKKDERKKMEELPAKGKSVEEALPRLKECDVEKASRLYQGKTGVGCDGFHPKVPLDLAKKNKRRNRGVL